MIRVYRKVGDQGLMLNYKKFNNPFDAEKYYEELCETRTEGPGVVKLSSRMDFIPDGHYRTDMDWTHEREQDIERINKKEETV